MTGAALPLERPNGVTKDSIWIFHRLEFGFLGLDAESFPVAIFPLQGAIPVVGRSPGVLRLDYCTAAVITIDGERWSTNCGLITLLDRKLEKSFLALVRSISRSLAHSAYTSARELGSAFAAWEMLFQKRRRLSPEEEMGLWGELFFLLSCPSIDRAVACWRGPNAEDFDFLANHIALEVKTTKRHGIHNLSHNQASSISQRGSAYIISICVGENALRGTTLPDIIDTIAKRVIDNVSFEERLMSTTYSHADSHLYVRRFSSIDEMSLFDIVDVPKVRAFDPGVLSLSYRVQLNPQHALSSEQAELVLSQAFSENNNSEVQR